MSLFTINIVPNVDSEVLPSDASASQMTAARRRTILADLAAYFESVAGGVRQGTIDMQRDAAAVTPTYIGPVGAGAVAASGTCTITGGSGSETATINGVGIAVTWATSDANTASLLAAAINASANALVAGLVTAAAVSNVVTITAVTKGTTGNCITLAATGTGNVASGARLTGGVNATANLL